MRKGRQAAGALRTSVFPSGLRTVSSASVPYSVPRELLMDVLHYGADAEIVEPKVLREQARAHLQLALGNYQES